MTCRCASDIEEMNYDSDGHPCKASIMHVGTRTLPRRRCICLCLALSHPRENLSAPEDICLKASNRHTIDDGDRFGECLYAIVLHGWDGEDAGDGVAVGRE